MNFIRLRGEDGKWHDVFILNGEIMLPISMGEGADSLVVGRYEKPDKSAILIVGIGDGEESRKNAFVIKETGEVICSGSIQAPSFIDADGNKYVSEAYVDEQIATLRAELSKG